jgi:hypothetical protein
MMLFDKGEKRSASVCNTTLHDNYNLEARGIDSNLSIYRELRMNIFLSNVVVSSEENTRARVFPMFLSTMHYTV